MVGSLMNSSVVDYFIGLPPASHREFPASGITMHIVKERLRQGQSVAFVSYESEIDWTKYDHIFDPK